MPTLGPLEAEVKLITGKLTQDVENIKRQLAQLQAAARRFSAEGTSAFNAFAASTRRADQAGKAMIASLERNVRVLRQAAQQGEGYAAAQRKIAAMAAIAKGRTDEERAAIRRLVVEQHKLIAALKQQDAAAKQAAAAERRKRAEMERTAGIVDRLVSALSRIAVFTVAATVITRGFIAITQEISNAVSEGMRFNAQLEQTRIAIAAVLTSSREIAVTQGEAVDPTKSYTLFLSKAADLQKEILLRSIETLGTAEELQETFQRVVAFTSDQVATDEERLTLAQNILNAARLLGLTQEQIATEARQLLTLESNRGQQILQSLGITVDQLRVFKEQGTLVQELNRRMEAFSVIAKDVGLTWQGLTTSVQTFISFLSAGAFERIFSGLKQVLIGFRDEIGAIVEAGGLAAVLEATDAQLRQLGETLADLTARFIKFVAEATASFIDFAAENEPLLRLVATAFSAIADAVSALLFPVKAIVSAFSELASSIDRLVSFLPGAADQLESLEARFRSLASSVLAASGAGTLIGLLFGRPLLGAAAGGSLALLSKALENIIDLITDKKKQEAIREFVDKLATIQKAAMQLAATVPRSREELEGLIEESNKLAKEVDALVAAAAEKTPDLAEFFIERGRGIKNVISGLILRFEQAKKAQDEAQEAIENFVKSLKRQQDVLRMQIDLLEDVEKGVLTLREAEIKASIARQAVNENIDITDEKISKEIEKVVALQVAYDDLRRRLEEQERARNELNVTIPEQIKQLEREIEIIKRGLAAGKDALEIRIELAQAAKAQALGVEKLSKEDAELVEKLIRLQDEHDKLTNAMNSTSQATEDLSDSMRDAILTTRDLANMFEQSITGILRGTLDLSDALERQGIAIGARLMKGILFGKESEEHKIIGNITNLVGLPSGGIIGSIFAKGGVLAGQQFIGGLLPFFPDQIIQGIELVKMGLFDGISGVLKPGFQNIWLGLGGLSGVAFISGITSALLGGGPEISRAISGALGTAALIPGPQQPFVAGAAILSSLFGGGLFDFLFSPGRIEIEKSAAEKFFQKVFKDINFSRFVEPKVAEALKVFEEAVPALEALGAKWAQAFGDEATQGTVVRFAGQFLANLKNMGKSADEVKEMVLEMADAMDVDLVTAIEEINSATTFYSDVQGNALLSLAEFQEEVEEARRNLAKYGDTTNLTVAELEQLALENGNVGSTILTLNELYAGAIDLATGFSESIDAIALANKLLAENFMQVAQETELFNDSVAELASQVRNGEITIEEAILALNEMREAAGLAALELSDFTLDPEGVLDAISTIETNIAIIGQSAGEALSRGIEEGMSPEQIEEAFLDTLEEALRAAAIDEFISDFMADLFEGIDLSEPLSISGETAEELAKRVREAAEALRDLLEAAGLLPKAVDETLNALGQDVSDRIIGPIEQIGSSLANEIRDALLSGDIGVDELAERIQASARSALLSGIIDAVVQSFIVQPLVEQLFDPIRQQIIESLAAGVPLAEAIAIALESGTDAIAQIPGILDEALGAIEGILNSPELQDLADSAGKTGAPTVPRAPIGSSRPGRTLEDIIEENLKNFTDQLRELMDAIRRFVEGQAAETLADQINNLKSEAQDLINQLMSQPIFSLGAEPITFGFLFDNINRLIESFGGTALSVGDLVKALDPASELLKDLPEGAQNLVRAMIRNLDELLKGIGTDLETFVKQFDDIEKALKEKIAEAVESFLEPIEEFISGVDRDPIRDLIEQYQEFAKTIEENRGVLEEAGVDVDNLLDRLSGAFQDKLVAAIEDLIGQFDDLIPDTDSLADRISDVKKQFSNAIATLEGALTTLSEEGLLTPELESLIRGQIDRLKKALPDAIRAVADAFLEPVRDFIDQGLGEEDRLRSLFDEFANLRQSVLDNADALREAGIDVDEVLSQLGQSLEAQLEAIKENLLDPIETAISRLEEVDPRPLEEFFDSIAGAETLSQLEQIRDEAIRSIEERLRREEEAARQATEENIRLLEEQRDAEIDRLRELQRVEEEALRARADALDELISLREDQLRTELNSVEELIRGTEDLRRVALRLREEAESLLLAPESPLTPIQRFAEAQRQFESLLARARAGDAEAAAALAEAGRTFISEAQATFASSQPFIDVFNRVRSALLEVTGIAEAQADAQDEQLRLQKESLEAQLAIKDSSERIAELTKELGLTGGESLSELKEMRNNIDERIRDLQDAFERQMEETRSSFDTAIELQRSALESKLDELRSAAADELRALASRISDKLDDLTVALKQSIEDNQDAVTSSIDALRIDTTGKLDELKDELSLKLDDVIKVLAPKVVSPPPPPPPAPFTVPSEVAKEAISRVAKAINISISRGEYIPHEAVKTLLEPHAKELRETLMPLGLAAVKFVEDITSSIATFKSASRYFTPGQLIANAIIGALKEMRAFPTFQGGGFVPAGTVTPGILHGPEVVIPTRSNAPAIELDYGRLKEVFSEAIAESREPSEINIPIQVITEDGEMIVNRTIRRIGDMTASGKIIIDARGVGRLRRI